MSLYLKATIISTFCDVYLVSDRYEILRLRQRVVERIDTNLKTLISFTKFVLNYNIEELVPKVMSCMWKRIHNMSKRALKELKGLNDSTHDKLLEGLTKEVLDSHKYGLSLKYGKPSKRYHLIPKCATFEVFKTFIGLLYFDKLSLEFFEDDNDFQLIRKVCQMCDKPQNTPLIRGHQGPWVGGEGSREG